MPDFITETPDLPPLRITAGRAAPEWAPDAARLNIAFSYARLAFTDSKTGSVTRESFVFFRDEFRRKYSAYTAKWANVPEAIAHFEDRVVPAPAGWDD